MGETLGVPSILWEHMGVADVSTGGQGGQLGGGKGARARRFSLEEITLLDVSFKTVSNKFCQL